MMPRSRVDLKKAAKAILPVTFVAVLYIVSLLVFIGEAIESTDGTLVYPLDDTYIHMAMAKNLALHGSYGVTREGFSGSSSSPVWTLLIALSYLIFGVQDWSPLVLAALSGLGVIFALDGFLRTGSGNIVIRMIGGAVIAFLIPLVPIVFTGMEHAAHIMSTLMTLLCLDRSLRGEDGDVNFRQMLLWLLIATALRYETVFITLGLVLWFMYARQYPRLLFVALAGTLPFVVYAAISLLHGWPAVPATLLVKSAYRIEATWDFLRRLLYEDGLYKLYVYKHLSYLFILLLLVLLAGVRARRAMFVTGAIVAIAFMLHMLFAGVGWFYRYEGYLIGSICALGTVAWLQQAAQMRDAKKTAVVMLVSSCLGIMLLFPVAQRAKKAMSEIAPAAVNIREQQHAMATIIGALYPRGARVAASDIGAICFYNDIALLDLGGLASLPVLELYGKQGSTPAVMERLIVGHKPDIVVLYYEDYFGRGTPPENLYPSFSLTVSRGVTVALPTVTFLTTSPERSAALWQRFQGIRPVLPPKMRIHDLTASKAQESTAASGG